MKETLERAKNLVESGAYEKVEYGHTDDVLEGFYICTRCGHYKLYYSKTEWNQVIDHERERH